MKTSIIFHSFIILIILPYIMTINIPSVLLNEGEGEEEESKKEKEKEKENEKKDETPKIVAQKEFIINREEIENEDNTEEIFSPYEFSSNIFEKGYYVFDTASFYSWKNNKSSNTSENDIDFIGKKDEKIYGTIKFSELNMDFIEVNNDKYKNNFGSICIPKGIPQSIKEKINNTKYPKKIKYSYLDLINSELQDDEKYVNYIQDTINTGKIIFGKRNDIFDEEKTSKIIKNCSCISPPDDEEGNEYLNFWNCKIDYFTVNNIKMPASYSILLNGEIIAVFAIEEEYIIAPKITGTEIIKYYEEIIVNNSDTTCEYENYTPNTKMLVCQTFNFAELPDFNIILDGEIYLIALSFDLFKEKNETHLAFKILLNEAYTKEYWFLGDPIIKNYNLLFNYSKPGNETITIVQSDKYESITLIVFFCISAIITLLFYIFLITIRLRKVNKETIKIKDKDKRNQSKKIKNIIKNQNDFEVPEENITIENMNKYNYIPEDKKIQENNAEEEESNSDSNSNSNSSINNDIKNLGKKDKEIKTKSKDKENHMKNIEIEMANINNKITSSDEEDESDLNADDEGGIQPLNHRKLKNQ